eukprot:496717-Amorphochlora_amoeboformis.AAC.1
MRSAHLANSSCWPYANPNVSLQFSLNSGLGVFKWIRSVRIFRLGIAIARKVDDSKERADLVEVKRASCTL